jgi:hypothetical protein
MNISGVNIRISAFDIMLLAHVIDLSLFAIVDRTNVPASDALHQTMALGRDQITIQQWPVLKG